MSEDRLRDLFDDLSAGLPDSDAAGTAWRRARRIRRRRATFGVTAACAATVAVVSLAGTGVLPLSDGGNRPSDVIDVADEPGEPDVEVTQPPGGPIPHLPCAVAYDIMPAESLEHMVSRGGSGGPAEPHEAIVVGRIVGIEEHRSDKVVVVIEVTDPLRQGGAFEAATERIHVELEKGGSYNDGTPACPIEEWRTALPAGTAVVVFGDDGGDRWSDPESGDEVPLLVADPRGFVLEHDNEIIGAWDLFPFNSAEAGDFRTITELADGIRQLIE